MIEDARNRYTWNADNNLIRVESKDGTSRIDYVYDHQSRRTVRRAHTRAAATENWTLKTENFYLYDDWNLVADVSAVTGHGSGVTGQEAEAVRYYTWGRDLSGSLQGAGGVGGLLAISKGAAHRFPTYDANGNIGQLIDRAGAVVAAYAYDPFGNVTEMAGAEAAENPWRFSTKPVEAGTGWLYYGYRWYDAEMGRWPSRDPIEERGGVNLHGFVGNDGANVTEYLGLEKYSITGIVGPRGIEYAGLWGLTGTSYTYEWEQSCGDSGYDAHFLSLGVTESNHRGKLDSFYVAVGGVSRGAGAEANVTPEECPGGVKGEKLVAKVYIFETLTFSLGLGIGPFGIDLGSVTENLKQGTESFEITVNCCCGK